MKHQSRVWKRILTSALGGTALLLLCPPGAESWAGDEAAARPAVVAEAAPDALPANSGAEASQGAVAQDPAQPLGLAECIQLALERQPSLAARRASLAAAQDGLRGLESIHIPSFIARDLPIRRHQAQLGVTIATAGLDQAEHETVYAVTRTYLTVLFARAQQEVTSGVVDHLTATLDTARRLVQGGSREVTTNSVDKTTVYLRLAETRRDEAALGVDRATAALREAIGGGPEMQVRVASVRLPEPQANLNREEIISLAMTRRGELVQVSNAATIACLEVNAQGKSCLPTKQTFAAGADIHAQAIPQGIANSEYRPGAIPPEYPTLLAGSRRTRMDRARDLDARADAVVDKTRNLIGLEAEDAFLRWQEAARKVPRTREAAEKGSQLSEDTRRDFGAEQKVKVEDVLTNEVLAAQARAQYNEALYQQGLALALIERVTAGGFNSGLTAQPSETKPQSTQPR